MIRHSYIQLALLCAAVLMAVSALAQKEPFEIRDNKMLLTLDKRWDKAQLMRILSDYDLSRLSTDTVFRFGHAGVMRNEGWMVKKKGKHTFVVYKPLSFSNETIDMISQPWSIASGDSTFNATSNAFNDTQFGYNQWRTISVSELANGYTLFTFKPSRKASQVFLSGSFNQWSTGGLPMKQDGDLWTAEVKLIPGRYEYKFIVDGKWQRDFQNELTLDDNNGGFNSVYYKPNYTFTYPGRTDAREVILTGSFCDWDEKQLRMNKTATGWEKAVFLPIGTYAYKFIVDGQWFNDPANQAVRPDGAGNFNSFLSIGEPTLFQLKGYTDANQVLLAGTFNGWNPVGLVMNKTADGWELPYVLRPGNYEYKFIVEGQWTLDRTAPIMDDGKGEQNNFVACQANYTFRLKGRANARYVTVTGNFNNWLEPGYPLQRTADGWELNVYLPQGKTTYKFVVDGEWLRDPDNQLWEENEYRTGNSVVWIK